MPMGFSVTFLAGELIKKINQKRPAQHYYSDLIIGVFCAQAQAAAEALQELQEKKSEGTDQEI